MKDFKSLFNNTKNYDLKPSLEKSLSLENKKKGEIRKTKFNEISSNEKLVLDNENSKNIKNNKIDLSINIDKILKNIGEEDNLNDNKSLNSENDVTIKLEEKSLDENEFKKIIQLSHKGDKPFLKQTSNSNEKNPEIDKNPNQIGIAINNESNYHLFGKDFEDKSVNPDNENIEIFLKNKNILGNSSRFKEINKENQSSRKDIKLDIKQNN